MSRLPESKADLIRESLITEVLKWDKEWQQCGDADCTDPRCTRYRDSFVDYLDALPDDEIEALADTDLSSFDYKGEF